MPNLDWREVLRQQLAESKTWAEKEELLAQVQGFKKDLGVMLWGPDQPLELASIQAWVNNPDKTFKEAQMLLEHPALTRAKAEPFFEWASTKFGIWWAEDVRMGLVDRFVTQTTDAWWQELWKRAKEWQSTFEDANPGETEDLQEEWSRLMNKLLAVPGLSDDDIDWVVNANLGDLDILVQILTCETLSEDKILEITDSSIGQLLRSDFENVLNGYLAVVGERKNIHHVKVFEYFLDSAKANGLKLDSSFLTQLQKFESEPRDQALSLIARMQPENLAKWLTQSGAPYIKSWSRDLLNQLLSSSWKNLRIATAGALGKQVDEAPVKAKGLAR